MGDIHIRNAHMISMMNLGAEQLMDVELKTRVSLLDPMIIVKKKKKSMAAIMVVVIILVIVYAIHRVRLVATHQIQLEKMTVLLVQMAEMLHQFMVMELVVVIVIIVTVLIFIQ